MPKREPQPNAASSLSAEVAPPAKRFLPPYLAWIILVFILLLAIGAVYFYLARNKGDSWQAVFLDNEQVYFGKVVNADEQFVKLTDIYYLQNSRPIQPSDAGGATDLTLVKLGNELHGPTDEMRINRDRILFIETLKPDSKVMQAIESHSQLKIKN